MLSCLRALTVVDRGYPDAGGVSLRPWLCAPGRAGFRSQAEDRHCVASSSLVGLIPRILFSFFRKGTDLVNLVWLPNASGLLTTSCRGCVLTVGQRDGRWQWVAAVGGNPVRDGTALTVANAKTDAMAAAVEIAAAGSGAATAVTASTTVPEVESVGVDEETSK